jgi:phosphocarrier protein
VLQLELEIVNKLGLHARASVKLTQTAARFDSEVWLSRNGKDRGLFSVIGE